MKKLASLLVLGLLAGTVARAHAAPEITLEVVAQDDPKKDAPPDIQARVVSGTAAPALEKISLVQSDQKAPIEIKAIDLKTYAQGPESLGVAVAYEGWYVWIGNDSYSDDPANKFEGVWKMLTGALDKLNAAGPPDSKAALVWFGKGAQTRWQGALRDLTGDKIGSQKEIGWAGDRPVINWDLVAGIDEAVAQLNKMGTSRKVLIVIGHGTDTNPDTAQAELAERKKKLQADGITAYAIVVGEGAEDGNALKKMTPNVKMLESTDQLPAAISAIVDAIVTDRYYVRFSGADLKLRRSFTWDDQPHTFTLKVDKDEYETDELVLSPRWTPPWLRKSGGFPWLAVIGTILGVGLVAVIGVMVFKKKPAPEPLPMPVAAPAPAPAPAAPAGPMKTVMIGVGGDDQGFPVVGWIVPLNGPNQFQTFKLQAGATKIGTGGPAHIVINDGFMSTEHCQIVMSPAGFVLVDGGSTNGTYVNERKVDKHELVDNDVITMGKTNFRFKSIN